MTDTDRGRESYYADIPPQPKSKTKAKLSIIAGLMSQGGSVKDDSGFAAAKLHKVAVPFGYKGSQDGMNNTVSRMEDDGMLVRLKQAKRTYEIELGEIPLAWKNDIEEMLAVAEAEQIVNDVEPTGEVPSSPVVVAEPVVAPPEPVAEVVDEAVDYDKVAAAILAEVAEILRRPEQYEMDQQRLSEMIERAQRLSGENKRLVDEVHDLQFRLERANRKLGELQITLDKVIKDKGYSASVEFHKYVERFMRERPKGGKW
jgi:hypothetical protein